MLDNIEEKAIAFEEMYGGSLWNLYQELEMLAYDTAYSQDSDQLDEWYNALESLIDAINDDIAYEEIEPMPIPVADITAPLTDEIDQLTP